VEEARTLNEDQDKQKIREVIAAWLRATADGDLERVLSLMAEDVGTCSMRHDRSTKIAAGTGMLKKTDVSSCQCGASERNRWLCHSSNSINPTLGKSFPVSRPTSSIPQT
jgi:uncharacterized protein (TIGR02246 family)